MPESSDIWQGSLRAHVCRPDAPSSRGVLLLPMVSGISVPVRRFAWQMAEAGFVAVVWDPYSPYVGRENLTELSTTLADAQVYAEQVRWLDQMEREMGLSRLGVMGWCMGGRYSLLLAAGEPRLAACVAYYPSIREELLPHQEEDALEQSSRLSCATQVIYPGRDHVTSRDTFLDLQARLQERSAPTAVLVFPDAGHNFLAREEESNQAAARVAWPQTVAFFRAFLDEPEES